MICINQCPLEASALRNVFDDAQHSRPAQAISDANGPAYYPYPTFLTIEAAYGHLHARVQTAGHIRYTFKNYRERHRIVEVLATQTNECLQRTSVHALEPCACPGHLHPSPAQDALVDETRHEVGDDPVAEFAFNQSSLCLLPDTDILQLRHEVKRPTVAVANERNGQQDPDKMSVLVEVSLLHLIVRYGSFEHPLDELDIGIEILRMSDCLERRGQQLLGRVPNDPAQRGVDAQPTAVRRHERHSDGRKFKRATEPFLALNQPRVRRCTNIAISNRCARGHAIRGTDRTHLGRTVRIAVWECRTTGHAAK
jgi:hypothetical protein